MESKQSQGESVGQGAAIGQFIIVGVAVVCFVWAVIATVSGGAVEPPKVKVVEKEVPVNVPVNAASEQFVQTLGYRKAYELCRRVHQSIRYGAPFPKISKYNELSDVGSGHCGTFAYMFCRELRHSGFRKFTIYDLKNEKSGLIHSAVDVEINGKVYLFDPTVGVCYRVGMKEILKDPQQAERYDRVGFSESDQFGYAGKSFYDGVKIVKTYHADGPILSSLLSGDLFDAIEALPLEQRVMASAGRMKFMPKRLRVSSSFHDKSVMDVVDSKTGISSEFKMPVSIAIISDEHVILANYGKLLLLNLKKGVSQELKKPSDVKVWNPTGVHYNSMFRRLYVANYNGHNVLVFDVLADRTIRYRRQIAHEKFKSPENVSVSRDGRYIAVADYDGHAVSMFTDEGNLRWRKVVKQAHGVSFGSSDNFVYATALGSAQIQKFNLKGDLVGKAGSHGWGRERFLWPTDVCVSDKGVVTVADAHTGQISLHNEGLTEFAALAGNGPGLTLFNMPYSVEWERSGTILVADSFRHRIVRIDPRTQEIITVYRLGRMEGSDVIEAALIRNGPEGRAMVKLIPRKFSGVFSVSTGEPLGIGYVQNYLNADKKDEVIIELPMEGRELPSTYQPAYNYLVGKEGFSLMLNGAESLLTRSYFYFVWGGSKVIDGKRYTILGSPQCSVAIVVCEGLAARVRIEHSCWLVGESIVGDGFHLPMDSLLHVGVERINAFKRDVGSEAPLMELIRRALQHKLSLKEFQGRIRESGRSEEGKKLFGVCIDPSATDAKLVAAAKAYMESIVKTKRIYLMEFVMAKMILQRK